MNLTDLKKYFADNPPPTTPFVLSSYEIITNQKAFVDAHISFLENNSGKHSYLPYFNTLIKYYNHEQRN